MSFSKVSCQRNNRLLASLSQEIYQQLLPHLEPVTLESQQILYQAGEPISHVYFPQRSLISLTNLLSDGSTLEVGLVGSEGLVGIPVILGGDRSPQQAIVQIGDQAIRLRSQVLQDTFKQHRGFQISLLQYVQAVFLQMCQLAACHRFHSIRERLARQLLLIQDALQMDQFFITHESLAQMLGTRRSGITVAAGELSRLGIIRYSRGRMTILQRENLETESCECYEVIHGAFDRCLEGTGDRD